MSHFEEYGYQVVKNAISKETAELAAIEFIMLRSHVPNSVDDDLVQNAFYWYGSFISESLLQMLQPKVESVTGLKLHPTYSYGRIYYNGAEMPVHTDRPSCEYSATLTIDVDHDSHPWPLGLKDLKGEIKDVYLDIGDMCVYRGTELEHWRHWYEGQCQIQFFLHYVDQNGKYSDYKYDKREMLAMPLVEYENMR